ncbi:MAG TPA: hypothetical protein V6D28_06275 [Leptolyngbyaceae cyanobacterium]
MFNKPIPTLDRSYRVELQASDRTLWKCGVENLPYILVNGAVKINI